jgi:hypothetical protein
MMISLIWTMFLIVSVTVTLTVTMSLTLILPLIVTMTVTLTVTMILPLLLTVTMTMTMTVSAIRQCIAEVCFPPGQLGSEERESLDHHSPRDMHPSIPV